MAAAIAILERTALEVDDGLLTLWCQAQERMAGLERMAGQFQAAVARWCAVLEWAGT